MKSNYIRMRGDEPWSRAVVDATSHGLLETKIKSNQNILIIPMIIGLYKLEKL